MAPTKGRPPKEPRALQGRRSISYSPRLAFCLHAWSNHQCHADQRAPSCSTASCRGYLVEDSRAVVVVRGRVTCKAISSRSDPMQKHRNALHRRISSSQQRSVHGRQVLHRTYLPTCLPSQDKYPQPRAGSWRFTLP
ncbi:hypothetical protein GQ602_003406 [Ophiocordyceps camponoti-floridani]|uniref:Uncharacterized protein n=1 Tax=Ophiocordyceps camponoti-floridani TaxID=2030778 RepID=A0A8H4VEH2_9HYPO|nr:hypothetical protein GQ602_003406 [Ophiocordyceps camponoti-floridani]